MFVDGNPVDFATRAELELIAMLALNPTGLTREEIGDRLWPEDDPMKVAHRVDNLISSVRRAMMPATRIRREHRRLVLDLQPGESDVRDAVAAAQSESRERNLAEQVLRALLHDLRQPLLGGRAAPWIVAEQGRLLDFVRSLEKPVRRSRG